MMTLEDIEQLFKGVKRPSIDCIFRPPSPVSVEEAVRSGLLDEDKGTFTDASSGQTMSVSSAIIAGLLKLTSAWPRQQDVLSGVTTQQQQQPERRTDLAVVHQRGRGTGSDSKTEEHMANEDADEFERDVEGGKEKVSWSQRREFHTRQIKEGLEAVSIQVTVAK